MVDSKYSTNIYKSFKISTGAVMKNPEIPQIVSDHLKTKKMNKNVVKKLCFVIRYVSYWCKTQQMCDKTDGNYPHALAFVPECYKAQKLWNKFVHTYSSTIKYVSYWCKTQEVCGKAVDRCHFCLIL